MSSNIPFEYVLIYVCLLFLHLISLTFDNRLIKVFLLFVTWGFLAIFSGTRVCVGGDWIGYRDLFRSQNDLKFDIFSSDPTEFVFRLLAYCSNYIGFSFEVFNLIVSILTCIFLFLGIKKISIKYSFLFTLVYFSIIYFNHQFGLIRTGLAASLFFYSLSFLLINKKIYSLLGIVMSNVHNTAFFPFFLGLIFNRKFNKYISYFFILVTAIFIFKSELLLNILLGFLDIFNSKYLNYAEAADIYLKKSGTTNTAFMVSGIFIYYLYKKPSIEIIYINITAFYILVNLAFPYQAILGRLNSYLLIPVWIFIIRIIENEILAVRILLNLVLIVYSSVGLSLILFDKDLALFRNYQTWLFDFSRTFDQCTNEFQF